MKLWISGEIDSDIADSFRKARNEVEEAVNLVFSFSDYGNSIVSWDVIMIISNDIRKEIFKYNKKTKEADVKIVLGKNSFQSMNILERKLLIISALIRGVDGLSALNIDNFNSALLKQDLLNLEV